MSRLHQQLSSLRFVISLGVAVAVVGVARGQSSTRSAIPQASPVYQGSTVAPGSNTRSVASTPVGLEGYCPVCVIETKKWVAGKPSIQATYDGKTYYFPGEEQKQMFVSNPQKYAPVLGGDCAVCVTEMGSRSRGNIRYAALAQNRLFLFPNSKMKEMFVADPKKYTGADLALGGKCSVCRVEMNQDVAGDPNVSQHFGGMKYLFASEDQRKMFMANPSKYAQGLPAASSMIKGSTTK